MLLDIKCALADRVPGGWFTIGSLLLLTGAMLDCTAMQLAAGDFDAERSARWTIATILPLTLAAGLLVLWQTSGRALGWRGLGGAGLLIAAGLLGMDLILFGDPSAARWWELPRNKVLAAGSLVVLAWRLPIKPLVVPEREAEGLSQRELEQIAAASFLRAAGNYVEIGSGPGLVRGSLSKVSASAKGEELIRIHRCFAVRPSAVSSLRNDRTGLVAVRLKDGGELPVGRRYRANAYRLRSCRSSPSS